MQRKVPPSLRRGDLHPIDGRRCGLADQRADLCHLLPHVLRRVCQVLHRLFVIRDVVFDQLVEAADELLQPIRHTAQGVGRVVPGNLHAAPGGLNAQARHDADALVVGAAAAQQLLVLHEVVHSVEELDDLPVGTAHQCLDWRDVGGQLSADLHGQCLLAACEQVGEQATGPGIALGVQTAQQAGHLPLVAGEAELLGGGGFQLVRLVNNKVLVLWQHAVLHRDIRE